MTHLYKLISPSWYWPSVRSVWGILCSRRELLWEMSKLELRERYVGQVVGIFWAVIMPLMTMAVYLFIFAFVFKAKMPEAQSAMGGGWGGSYALYLLSGLIPWMAMQDIMSRSATVVSGNASLVKQVVFPLEILPLKIFYPAVINLCVTLGIFLLYGLIGYGLPTALVLLLPVIIALQLLMAGGIALIFSAAGAYLRDMKDIVGVLCFVLVYAMPIFFAPGMLPDWAYTLLLFNPLSHMIVVYHDVLYYGHVTAPLSWVIFPLFSVVMWFLGCRVFATLKQFFGNVL